MPIIDAFGSAVSGVRAYMEAERAGDERVMQREYDRTNQLLDNLIKGHGVSESQERMRIARLQTQQRERLMPSEVTLQEQAVRKGELEIGAYEKATEKAEALDALLLERVGMTLEEVEALAAAGKGREEISRAEERRGISAVRAEERAGLAETEARRKAAPLLPKEVQARIDLTNAQVDKLTKAAALGQDVDYAELRRMNDYLADDELAKSFMKKEGITYAQAWKRVQDSPEIRQMYSLITRLVRSKSMLVPNMDVNNAIIGKYFTSEETSGMIGSPEDVESMKQQIEIAIRLITERLMTSYGIKYMPREAEEVGNFIDSMIERWRSRKTEAPMAPAAPPGTPAELPPSEIGPKPRVPPELDIDGVEGVLGDIF